MSKNALAESWHRCWSWAYRTELAGCGGAGAAAPRHRAPPLAGAGARRRLGTAHVRAYPPPPGRWRGALISAGLPSPHHTRAPDTDERARHSRPRHRSLDSGATRSFGLLRFVIVLQFKLDNIKLYLLSACEKVKMLVEDSQNSRAMMTKKYAHCPLKKRPVMVREERPATPPTTPPHPAHLATTLYYDYHCK